MRQIVRCARPVGLLAALVVVLGILGMHALAHPDSSHPSAAPEVGGAAYAHHASGGTDAHVAPMPSATAPVEPTFGSGPKHALGDMVMLCAAMLAAAGTMLVLLWSIRRSPRVWAFVAPAAASVRPTRWLERVDSGPPAVWRFSVIRC